MEHTVAAYRLVRRAEGPTAPPRLDEAQRRVVDHAGGPLLVLAGPGTGKTTTIVEAAVERVERRGIDPGRVLVLTFSRRAAEQLRQRITARLRRTVAEPLAMTFHSYAYALVRREFLLAGEQPPRLLSGPEHLLEIRRMLRGEASDGGTLWPERLRPALATRGFAEELRDVLLRAVERGLDGPRLTELGRRHGRDDWVAAGRFLDRYAGRFDIAPVPAYDYAEIIRVAAALVTGSGTGGRERQSYDTVLVDEYQDSDPAQETLLEALAGGGRELIAVGDPDQSIYGFRGADVRVISEFPDRFRTVDGRPAPVIVLRTCRRSGRFLLAASRRVAGRLPIPAAAASVASPEDGTGRLGHMLHRDLVAPPSTPAGRVRIVLAGSASQEAALIADVLRRAHLTDHVPWSAMAVLVRSATRQMPLLRRALATAGVPVAVTGEDLPLADEPGARPFVTLLRCAVRPETLDERTAAELLTGPLGGTDTLGLRRLRRWLRAGTGPGSTGGPRAVDAPADPAAPSGEETAGGPLRASGAADDVLVRALRDPRELTLLPPPIAEPAERVARLLAVARDAVNAGGTAEDVLWAVWEASGLAATWEQASAAGGPAGAAADRDLDAVVALFDAAARFTRTLPPGTPGLFVDSLTGQEIPGDSIAERAPRESAVQLLTAHRSKGLEWDVVVVAGVQEETWPDLRRRGSLLGVDELAEATRGTGEPSVAADTAAAELASKLLAEERRLFYVAVTRARRWLVVTAVDAEDGQVRPSRFLDELAGDDVPIERAASVPRRWLSLAALTADLRRVAADRARPAALRRAAAAELARLARAGVRGAHPDHWYALTSVSDTRPVVLPGQQARLSPSQVESFTRCGLRWLLESAVGAGATDDGRRLGAVIHALAALATRGCSADQLDATIDELWQHLDFGSPWYATAQRERARRMVRRFLDWHLANPRRLVDVERRFQVRVGRADVAGRVDRLERDDRGRGVVVDLKTGASPMPGDEVARNPQLGVYQLAVLLGAFEELGVTEPGGAELLQVGSPMPTGRARVQRQPALAEDPEPGWARDLVESVAAAMGGSVFEAKANRGCRTCPVASCCPLHPRGAQVEP